MAGTALSAADMYSAASGKDWVDGTERGLRAAFSLFDLIPAGKYLSGLVKMGKTAGIVGVKTSLKTSWKEGLEPQLVSGVMPSSNGKLANIADNLSAFAKNLDGSVDDIVEAGSSTPTKLNLNEVTPSNVKLSEVEIASYNREQILKNIEESRLARKSSNFDDFLRKEYEFEGKYFPERVELANGKRGYLSADSFDGQQIPVRSREFVNAEGYIKWPEADGFVTDSAGNPITEPANLKAGQMIDRYGPSSGCFTSPIEDGRKLSYTTRGLPYPEGYQPYHKYEVVKDITEENIKSGFSKLSDVDKQLLSAEMERYGKNFSDLANPKIGKISKIFGQGGGIQIQFESSVKWYESMGLLSEVSQWKN